MKQELQIKLQEKEYPKWFKKLLEKLKENGIKT